MLQTPLNVLHREQKARLVDFAGWEMPVMYTSIVEEHNYTRQHCSVFDVSHMGRVEFRGPVAVYADEVDVHLNPKIGLDWMGYGQQKEVLTPGQNEKCYVAGAMDAVTGALTWVDGERKNSVLFIALLQRLVTVYAEAPVIHVILDNYRIHASRITRRARAAFGGRIVLHFLPPYCPNENKIERLWQDLHAAVTRNHRCRTMSELMQHVYRFLQRRQRQAAKLYLRPAA
jgi:transposase